MFENLETGGVHGKYRIIKSAAKQYPVTELCSILGVSRSGYYRYVNRQNQDRVQETKERIKAIYDQRKGTYGYRRIEDELEHQYGEKVNHKKVLRLMQELGLKAVIRRKRNYRSPYQTAENDGRIADNLLKRDFTADKPNQKWVTDVTQYRVGDERLYLSAIKDLCSNEIIAYHMSKRNDNELVLETFKSAFETQKDATGKIAGLIVHSDQGFQYFQYTSHEYNRLHIKYGFMKSMSRVSHCLDNQPIERFWGTYKSESYYLTKYDTYEEVLKDVNEYIRYYNNYRYTECLGVLSPNEYRRAA